MAGTYTNAGVAIGKPQGKRKNKSQRLAGELKAKKSDNVRIDNPFAELMEKAAKHIEWLELIVTGISHKDRNTIAALRRRRATDKRMIADRDYKIKRHNDEIKALNAQHKKEITDLKRWHKEEIQEIMDIKLEESEELREAIEQEFIKQLQSSRSTKSDKTMKKMYKAMLEDSRRDIYDKYYGVTAASNNAGWV